MLSAGHRIKEVYEVVRPTAQGGMAHLYQIRHITDGTLYVLKLLSHVTPKKTKYFYDEANLLIELGHPNVPRIADMGTTEGYPFIIMEWLEGETLEDRLAREGTIQLDTVIEICRQIGDVLAIAHPRGVVHRHLKPASVFLCRHTPDATDSERLTNFVKVLDFGIALVPSEAHARTAPGTSWDNPEYMAPEQAFFDVAAVDARSDQYRLAMIAYTMLRGQPAFTLRNSYTLEELVAHHNAMQTNPPPLLPAHVPIAVAAVLMRALSKSSEDRYPTVKNFIDALVRAQQVSANPLQVGQHVGSYRLVRKLGASEISVYEAVRDESGLRVLVKVFAPEDTASQELRLHFLNKVLRLQTLNHPGLFPIIEYGALTDGAAYVVCEFSDGQTLAERLGDRKRRLSFSQAMAIAYQIARILAFAHGHLLRHKRLNPNSVMLITDSKAPSGERVVLYDFWFTQLQSSSLVAPARYCSPEQCMGASSVYNTDVYSLGLLLFEMLTGESPYAHGDSIGENVFSWSSAHYCQTPRALRQFLPNSPAELDTLLTAMLNKTPRERPSVLEVERCLQHCSQKLGLLQRVWGGEPLQSIRGALARLSVGAVCSLAGLLMLFVLAVAFAIWPNRGSVHMTGTRAGALILLAGIGCSIGTWAIIRRRHRRDSKPVTESATQDQKQESRPVNLFVNYADQDKELVVSLETSLAQLKRQGIIASWDKNCVEAGAVIADELARHIREADIILLLVSPDFMTYCIDCLEPAMERHRSGSARVIPVLLRPTDIEGAPFDGLQSLPRNKRPVTSWPNRDEAWLNIARGIRQVAARRIALH